ncbi:MAG: hypothetical protein JO345_24750 [Streptosporangiaceae bacterium]|nr:hypothetical protein [Streptosporangiaceae bacterium]
MHRSRLSTLLIDVPSDQVPEAAAFWSAALGVPANSVPDEEQFTSQGHRPDGHALPRGHPGRAR